MNIPETLYRLRTARGMSQEALADALGVSRQAVSEYSGLRDTSVRGFGNRHSGN